MIEDLVSGRIKSCYISAPSDINLRPLRDELLQRGISLVSPELSSGSQGSSEFSKFLSSADLVIGILSRERRSDWTLFELGMAWSAGRQVLLVIPPGASLIPPAGLSGVLQVRANPSNVDAITFALDQLQTAPTPALPQSLYQAAEPIGDSAAALKAEAFNAVKDGNGLALEQVIFEALQRAQLTAIVNETTNRDANADFAVWIDEISTSIGNPLLIEVKLRLRNLAAVHQAASKFSSAIASTGTRFGLLVYGEGPSKNELSLAKTLPFNVLALPVSELLDQLATRSFPQIVVQLRNRRVHGVDA